MTRWVLHTTNHFKKNMWTRTSYPRTRIRREPCGYKIARRLTNTLLIFFSVFPISWGERRASLIWFFCASSISKSPSPLGSQWVLIKFLSKMPASLKNTQAKQNEETKPKPSILSKIENNHPSSPLWVKKYLGSKVFLWEYFYRNSLYRKKSKSISTMSSKNWANEYTKRIKRHNNKIFWGNRLNYYN